MILTGGGRRVCRDLCIFASGIFVYHIPVGKKKIPSNTVLSTSLATFFVPSLRYACNLLLQYANWGGGGIETIFLSAFPIKFKKPKLEDGVAKFYPFQPSLVLTFQEYKILMPFRGATVGGLLKAIVMIGMRMQLQNVANKWAMLVAIS